MVPSCSCEVSVQSPPGTDPRVGTHIRSTRRASGAPRTRPGATGSTINLAILASLGYDVTAEGTALRIITGSGTVHAPRIAVDRLAALGQVRQQFPVLGHTLPAGTNVDGVLGLDFLRGQRLEVDFRAGFVTLD